MRKQLVAAVGFVGLAGVMMGVQSAAAETPAETVKALDCSALTPQSLNTYNNRFGIAADQWDGAAEAALAYKIDNCFSLNMNSTAPFNEAFQKRRKDLATQQIKDGIGPIAKQAVSNQEQQPVGATSYNPTAQQQITGYQLFVEKYCPQIQPDEDKFQFIDQSSTVEKIHDPATMTAATRAEGSRVLNFLETNAKPGLKPLSPYDIQWKCAMMGTMFTSGPGLYRYVQR